ncbi:hypothetical protein FQN60_010204 [Etheostoma spectabile]|uniref:CW-type domain-containing protein n=1 Tax=Etheostoma spectabile TaxID=54343 RepID=A0A5J5D5Z8_9PERO|nr:hypothetical protein FQN60_010204 [Etheostoma spectabile]
MARLSEHGIRLSSMSPSFLNSNSTSHTWPFSAVAELIDNALDPGVLAKQIWIDVLEEAGHLCLTFTDNGSGMTPHKLHKMLSFGFTEKGSGKASQQAIGVYGNGFKSGSMRLGRDALIFTKNGGCQTVGMLSQTYLENIKAQAVIVPINMFVSLQVPLCPDLNPMSQSLVVTEDSEASLAAILQHSILTSQEQLHAHFDSILSKKGTKILIWNIRRAKDGKPEIDFESDVSDFRLPEIQIEELKKGLRNSGSLRAEHDIPEMHYSLRAYLSILYLKPRTQIILRGKKIQAKLVSKRLTHIEHDVYKPHFSKEKVKVTFGLNPKNKDHYGIMMYHRNRLIKAYEKVGGQLKASGQRAGVGVIGIIECNFLKPAHNKQDFEYTKEYRLTLGALGLKLNDYWKEVTEKKAREREFQALERDENEAQHDADEGPTWLQCEECLKWRKVPASHYNVLPESWNCSQNPNPRYRSCFSPEEAEDSEELLTPSYQKNHKKPSQVSKESIPKAENEKNHWSHKRKSESLFYCVKKKPCLSEGQEPSSEVEPLSLEKIKQDSSGRVKKPSDAAQRTPTCLTWTHSLPCTQTVMVSPLSRTEGQSSRPLPPEGSDREANVQKLAGLEKEVQRLHRLLGLEVTKTSQGTMTTADSSAKQPIRGLVTPPASTASREVACQTEVAESCTSSSSPARAPGCQEVVVLGARAVCVPKEQAEQNMPKKKTETPSRTRVSDSEACEDSRSSQENLRTIRNNVVALLTVLLPQLDLTGISLDTSDVDNILQQIIEVNSLKLSPVLL